SPASVAPRSFTTTFAPARASAIAIPRPMPRPDPVTSAVLPSSIPMSPHPPVGLSDPVRAVADAYPTAEALYHSLRAGSAPGPDWLLEVIHTRGPSVENHLAHLVDDGRGRGMNQ